tara:strand:+ start:103 stop:498 length:396 start_codon:yes stop_codon:yes gene_type:complete
MCQKGIYILFFVPMNITEKYIEIIKPSLSPCQKKQFRDGWGWTLACPFCRDAQKRESKSNEKCASLYPVEGSFTYFFSCNRGLNGGVQGLMPCDRTMRFSTFLKRWNPPQCRKYARERELAKKNCQPKFPD